MCCFYRNVGKRKAVVKADKSGSKAKKGKLAKDPNKSKRPPSAFFVFLYTEGFRKTFKKENPNVNDVSDEKVPYEAKVARRKGKYQKLITAYNKKQVSDPKSLRIAKGIGSNSTKKPKSTWMPLPILFKAISNTCIFVPGSHRLVVLPVWKQTLSALQRQNELKG
ncbi:hypothetical protein AgCh_001267 [Apium graveolens]